MGKAAIASVMGNVAPGLYPLYGKEGKGRFLGGVRGNYVANLWVRTLAIRLDKITVQDSGFA
jgi:hypothetical protein